ncbi:MAG: CHASE domain-containing protein [Phycisphaerae bacterium]|nr:CHASE domain-containing protein [Phycisphaerae bacterium]
MRRASRARHFRSKRFLSGVIVGAAGIGVSLFAFWEFRTLESHHARRQFEAAAERGFEAIRHSVDNKILVLEAIQSVFNASERVDRNEFAIASAPHLNRQVDIQMLAWVPRVSATDRVQYETAARGDGMEKFQIVERHGPDAPVPAANRTEYFPVYYAEPYVGNEAVLGWDLTSDPAYAAVLALARDENRVIAMRYAPPIGAVASSARFVVFMPVYSQSGLLYSVTERRRNLRGFITGVFRIDDLVTNALHLLGPGAFDIRLSDVTDAWRPVFLYLHDAHKANGVPRGRHASSAPGWAWEGTLDVYGSRWLARCTPTAASLTETSTSLPLWALAGSLLVTFILATWVVTLVGRAAQIQMLVEQKTRDLRESEAKYKEAAHSAREATQSKSEFLANMSHEIRTPMTAILGFADVLLEHGNLENAPPERIEAAKTIKRNGEYLLGIINDILDLSKVEAGRMVVEHVSCHLCTLVADVASLVKVKADGKGLGFAVEYLGAVPEMIRTDPTRLRQILINLLGNAIKFTEVGGVRLVIRFIYAKDKPVIQFDVVDTGVGITEEQLARLFQPFTQADASTTRKFGGTGLGLSISKRFAEMLDGDVVVVDSEAGLGTRFRFTVGTGSLDGVTMIQDPLVVAPRDLRQTANANEQALQGCHILLAEDGPDNQRLIAHVLKKAGAEVTVKENGKLAVDAALDARNAGTPFDAILMDMQMPVMDGYEATRLLRTKHYTGPIIALTAHAMAGDRQKCIDAGCDNYATKPVNRQKLIETIEQAVQRGEPVAVIR